MTVGIACVSSKLEMNTGSSECLKSRVPVLLLENDEALGLGVI